jgi:TDG/mug DNA glycosylase family protein
VDAATRRIYEEQAADYESARQPRWAAEAAALGRRALPAPVVDLGCGPGFYTGLLGPTPIALDGALAMVRRTREIAPGAPVVQADLGALPFRPGSLGGGWARNTYVHLPAVDLPLALADLHRSLQLGAPVELTLFGGEGEGWDLFPDDDLPGRFFSTWPVDRVRDVVVGAGFDLDELEEHGSPDGEHGYVVRARRARTLPDTVGPGMALLVCGLNPSLRAADAGIGYVTPGNRFWPAAIAAGLVTRDRDPWHALRAHGVGLTDLVKRASPRADVLTPAEYRDGLARAERLCAWLRPRAVCFVGLAGWRAAVDRRAQAGPQPRALGGVPTYVLPSTSGANAAVPLAALVEHLRAALAQST